MFVPTPGFGSGGPMFPRKQSGHRSRSSSTNSPRISVFKASGSWVPQVLSTKGAQGLFTNLWFDEANQANILYFSRKSNAVFLLFGPEDGSSWSGKTVKLTGGSNLVATVTSDGTHAAYAYFDTVRLKLMTGDLL